MRSASMGTGDYLCITVRGGAPWGFSLRQGSELHHPLLVCQVDSRGRGAQVGLREGDEVVSLNGEPCADLTLPESLDLMENSDSLQLLVKRCGVPQPLGPESQREYFGEAEPNEEGLERTTLEVWPAGGSSGARGGEPYTCESQDEAYYGETESDSDLRAARSTLERRGSVTAGAVDPEDELAEDPRVTRPGGEPQTRRGDLVTSSSFSLGQVELTLQHPGRAWEGEGEGGKEEEEEEEEEERGRVLSDPQEERGSPVCVSFGSSLEAAESPEERDSESERDLGRPSKHRARHARLRRSESQSEKQVKEAKSKCKRIALLLTAAPNPNNKGVLMFKRRRQRAKKYTLVSYGTGETEPEDEEEDDEEGEDDQVVELTLLATSESELSEDLLANTQGRGNILGHDWDITLLEVEKKLNAQGEMERLPGTKGKGALMFAQRRQRIDEIAAEHEEMRRKGIPVEGVPAEAENVAVAKSPQVEEQSYMQTTVTQANQAFLDVNMQQLQHQQYQDQQQQQYLQTQQYPQAMNGTAHLQANELARSLVPNRTAKPFSGVQNRVPLPFSPSRNVSSPVSLGYTEKFRVVPPPVPVNTRPQVWSPGGEQIASRDERISVPAIKAGILQDTRKRGTARSTLPSKVSQLSMRGEKRAGFESGPEEDYLSLGAEACNFMQIPTVRSKDPPPVAPKPTINPASPPWATTQAPLPLSHSQGPTLAPGLAIMPTQSQSPQQHAAVSPWIPPQAQPQSPMNTWAPPHPQPPMNTWSPAQPQAHSQAPMNAWTPQPQKAPVSTAPPTQTHAPPHQPMKSWNQPRGTARSMVSRPMNSSYLHATKTLSTVVVGDDSSAEGLERPAMRGRGAELFARRQARMEKFVVDAETVQANKPPPTSPKPKSKSKAKTPPPPKHLNAVDVMRHQPYQLDPSLFTYEGLGRSCSLSLPRRLPSMTSRSDYGSPVTTPVFQPSYGPLERQASWMERAYKPPSPWEAASRNPLGLVDEAFAQRNIQQSIASNVKSAAQRKSLPDPPAEWKARVSYEGPRWGDARPEAPPAFTSPTKSVPAHYGPPFRQYQPQRSVTETSTGYAGDYRRPISQPGYRPMYSAAWRRKQWISPGVLIEKRFKLLKHKAEGDGTSAQVRDLPPHRVSLCTHL
ncbi:hypothetical protein SKAU_G00395180 [Synaphobranchus kaupii]|uniref:PDZ domain-containing protein n=1 Tax=Synaphobranchus kaupii TaxID=118154 RepID=A0A9Q1ECB4_SYNKA|nr:hypothetical protein SKAU_G00395180 [Synaphobranchus kaupii]